VPGKGWIDDGGDEEKKMNRRVRSSSVGAAIALLLSGTAPAQELDFSHELDTCVQICRSESGSDDCRLDADAARQLCVEQNGCDALRAAHSEACSGESRDEAACREARTRFRDCVTPCHEGFRAQIGVCMDRMATCVEEQCATELPKSGGAILFRHRFED